MDQADLRGGHARAGGASPDCRGRVSGRQLWITVLCLGMCATGFSCGYRFAGGGHLPREAQRVAVDIFENHTGESGLETLMTDALTDALTRRHAVLLPRKEADAFFHGAVISASTETIAHTAQNIAGERRVTVSISLKLKRPDGTVIRSFTGISDNETYAVSDDRVQTESRRAKALAKLSERLADDLVSRLSDDF